MLHSGKPRTALKAVNWPVLLRYRSWWKASTTFSFLGSMRLDQHSSLGLVWKTYFNADYYTVTSQ